MKISKGYIAAAAAFTVSLTMIVACDKVEDEEQKETATEVTRVANTKAAGTNISKVKDNFVPASLKTASGSGLALMSGENPCAGTADFFDCQPNLLKLYLAFGQNMVTVASELVPHMAAFIATKSVGDKGREDLTDAGSTTSIAYNVIATDSYEATMFTTKGEFLYLKVERVDDKDKYTVKVNLENDADRAEGSTDMTRVTSEILYTSETEFTVDVKMGGATCSAEDIGSPSYLNIKIAKADTTWKGKSMIYLPRWLTDRDATCDSTFTAANELYMYTDFAGNDTNTTASLYMAKSALDSTDDLGNYDIEDFCTNFASACGSTGGFGGSSTVIADTYKNAFCATDSGATWDSPCSDIATTDYGPAADWRLPAQLAEDKTALEGVSLPSEF